MEILGKHEYLVVFSSQSGVQCRRQVALHARVSTGPLPRLCLPQGWQASRVPRTNRTSGFNQVIESVTDVSFFGLIARFDTSIVSVVSMETMSFK